MSIADTQKLAKRAIFCTIRAMKISARTVFSLIFLGTIFAARLWVFILPPYVSTQVGTTPVHHFWIGLVVIILGWQLSYKMKVPIVAFGAGLFVDELAFILLGGGGDVQYWSQFSVTGLFIFIIVTLLLVPRIIFFMKRRPIAVPINETR